MRIIDCSEIVVYYVWYQAVAMQIQLSEQRWPKKEGPLVAKWRTTEF